MIWQQIVTLVTILFASHRLFASCQDTCLWSPTNLQGRTHATGSDATYSINSISMLSDRDRFTWSYDGNIAAQITYDAGNDQFTTVNPITRVVVSTEKLASNLVILSATVSAVTSSDNKVLEVTRSDCTIATTLGGAVTLTIKDCNSTSYGTDASAPGFPATCGLGCKVNFACTVSECGNFEAECQADTSWVPTQAMCSSVCGILPDFSRFLNGFSNISCGTSEEIVCEGGAACGQTTGTCLVTNSGPQLTRADSSFDCKPECSRTAFTASVQNVAWPNPRCGSDVEFQCLSTLVCGSTKFTRTCLKDGVWNDPTTPCFKTTCNTSVLQELCPADRCNYDDTTTIPCDEPFNYTCKSGAEETTSLPVYCVGENELNYTGSVCAILATSTLATESTSTPATGSSSTPDAETSQPLCSASCEVAVLQALCPEDTCSFDNVTEITCGEQFKYTCKPWAEDIAPSPVFCTGEKNKLNYTGSLCEISTTTLPTTAGDLTTASNLVSEQAAATTKPPCTACDQLFKDPHAWALGLGVTWGLAFLIFIVRLIMKYGGCSCRSKCCGGCCSCSMECCTPKDDNGCCNCYIRVLKPAEWVAGWCCCCKFQNQTRWWIGLGVYWLTCSVVPYVISLILLLVSVTECCSGNSAMIPGIVVGFIATPLQIFFTVASFSKPTYHRANSWKSKDTNGPDIVDHAGGHDSPSVGTKLVKRGSDGNDKPQVGSSSREEGVIKSTNLSTASDGNRG